MILARRFLTLDRGRALTIAARNRFPAFPDEQFKTIYIEPALMQSFKTGTEQVVIKVSFARGPADPQPLLDFCGRWLEDELSRFNLPLTDQPLIPTRGSRQVTEPPNNGLKPTRHGSVVSWLGSLAA